MALFGSNNDEKVTCNKCKKDFKLNKITHIDGDTYCKTCADGVIKEKEKKRVSVTPEQMKNIIVSTTSHLPGYEIQEFLGPMAVQVVMGVDAWRDMLSSLRSFWGGRSKGLERELASAYAYAFEDMKKEAFLCGADAVIGTEFDASLEVAGEIDKSNDKMIIVSGVGTAVKLKQRIT